MPILRVIKDHKRLKKANKQNVVSLYVNFGDSAPPTHPYMENVQNFEKKKQ